MHGNYCCDGLGGGSLFAESARPDHPKGFGESARPDHPQGLAKASVPITQKDSAKVPDAPSTEPVIVTEPPEWIDPPQVTQESKQ